MLASEALEVLGLAAGATPAEIKAAHRDLVKVWHPDRFGSDAPLRARAEEKLKQINQAYMVLRSGSGDVSGSGASPTAPAAVRVRPVRPRSIATTGLWVVRSLAVLLLFVIVFVVLKASGRLRSFATPEPPAAAQAPEMPPPPAAPSGADSAPPKQVSAAPFRVTALSAAQTARLDEVCAAQQVDSAARQRCVEAQLGLMTNAPGAPDLGMLDDAERQSIESTCATAKRGGNSGFNRCLQEQMAAFAADPARPDMTGLGAADRSQVETACRNAKEQRGPAAYNRCRIRLVQLLARSR